jgi:hypothetical protein
MISNGLGAESGITLQQQADWSSREFGCPKKNNCGPHKVLKE